MKIGDSFSSFDEFSDFKKKYEDEEFCQLYVHCSRTIENARKRGITRHINPNLKFYYVVYKCIYSGSYKSKAKGERPNRSTFRQQCPFIIRLKAKEDALVVAEIKEDHNHSCSKESYSNLPRQRQLDDSTQDVVKHLHDVGIDKNQIKDFIFKKTAKKVGTKDLNNWRANEKRKKLKQAALESNAAGSSKSATSVSPVNHNNEDGGQVSASPDGGQVSASPEVGAFVDVSSMISVAPVATSSGAIEDEHQMRMTILKTEHEMKMKEHEAQMKEHEAQMKILQLQLNIFKKVEQAIDSKKFNLCDILKGNTAGITDPRLFVIQPNQISKPKSN